jgi:hypothetical protein
VPLRLEEREAHAAADQQPVDLRQQGLDHGQLVGHLGAAEDHHVRRGRRPGQPPQDLDLAHHQPAGVARQPRGHVVHAGVLAVHRAEGVVHVRVGERGELVGEGRPLGVVLAGLPRVEPQVLQQGHLAGGQRVHGGPGGLADRVGGEEDGRTEQLAEAGRHRRQAEGRIRRALRAAQVGDHDHGGPGLAERGQGRQHRPDPAVVRDRPVRLVERDVQVGAHQHAPTRHAFAEQVVKAFHEPAFDRAAGLRCAALLALTAWNPPA